MNLFPLTDDFNFKGVFGKFSSFVNDSLTGQDAARVAQIHAQRQSLVDLTDEQLKYGSQRLRKEVGDGRIDHREIVAAFAYYSEAVRRELGIILYDVQLLGGLSLLRRQIAEMKTGEGKTFVGGMISYAVALGGNGVHFMTTNDYLAERDHDLVSPIFERLGMTLGLIRREQDPAEKQAAYRCDATYGPGYEFGFDYLRDQISILSRQSPGLGKRLREHQRNVSKADTLSIQTRHHTAIVDEADSVLIDEATTPLVLSASPDRPSEHPDPYRYAHQRIRNFVDGVDFVIDKATRKAKLTHLGLEKATASIEPEIRAGLRRPWHRYIEQAIHAEQFFLRDQHYIIRDDKILLVDGNTGRVFTDRTWNGGLHQAVEAKEGITISEENDATSRISRQQYFSLYQHLCGLSGTASESRSELKTVYGLTVKPIAPHRPCVRETYPLRCFVSSNAKWNAIAESVHQMHLSGRPILVGTQTIQASEIVAELLGGLEFELLNGKQDADEATMIAKAGKRGSITIATNMAGRGTDIRLGEGVSELGGLHVVVTEPHESARVDRQLIGRASRQGDPGSSQMFASADDRLIVQYAGWLARHIKRLANASGEVKADLTAEFARLQRRLERKAAGNRRAMFSNERWQEDAKSSLAKS